MSDEILIIDGKEYDKKTLNKAFDEEKERLERLTRLSIFIKDNEENLENLNSLKTSLPGLSYDENKGKSSVISSFENMIVKIADLEEDLISKKYQYILAKSKLLQDLSHIRLLQAEVIKLKYIEERDNLYISAKVDRSESRVRALINEAIRELAINKLKE